MRKARKLLLTHLRNGDTMCLVHIQCPVLVFVICFFQIMSLDFEHLAEKISNFLEKNCA